MMRFSSICLAALVLLGALPLGAPALSAEPETRLLRFPAIHGDRVVFTYAGDLYTVPAAGGVARRLTSDAGFEMFARFSPDGEPNRLHGAVRREHRGLRHAGRGRRPAARHLHRDPRPRRRFGPHGPQQHRHDVEG